MHIGKSVLYSLDIFQEISQGKTTQAYQKLTVQLGIYKFTW